MNKPDETHIMQLAAISTATLQNTETTIKDRIPKDSPYWTVAYADVCTAIDREIRERNRANAAEHDIQAYRGALGYSVPASHNGKLFDGTTPQCGICNSEYRKSLEAQLEAAQKACAEMRRQVGAIKHAIENNQPIPWGAMCKRMEHALSHECGKDFVPRSELDKLKEDIKPLVSAIQLFVEWCRTKERCVTPELIESQHEALAHAKTLGLLKK